MTPPTKGLLKQPTRPGFMGPLAILKVIEAADALHGKGFADDLLRAAQIHRLPAYDEPVREANVARLHQTLRRQFPEKASQILSEAGRMSADFVMDFRMPRQAQTMIGNMPWQMGAWILGRSLLQNSWTFAGDATLTTPNRLEFQLCHSAFTKGETSTAGVCSYHAALLGRMFRSLVHSDLGCTEVKCSATGQDCCHFKIHSVI